LRKYLELAIFALFVLSAASAQKVPLLVTPNSGFEMYNSSGDTWALGAGNEIGGSAFNARGPELIAYEIAPFNIQVPNVDPYVRGDRLRFKDTEIAVLKTYLNPIETVESLLNSQSTDSITIFNTMINGVPVVWGQSCSQNGCIYAADAYSSDDVATLIVLSTNPKFRFILDSIRITMECSRTPPLDPSRLKNIELTK
jgi:hypothetical protein